jgi:hypothetical protein
MATQRSLSAPVFSHPTTQTLISQLSQYIYSNLNEMFDYVREGSPTPQKRIANLYKMLQVIDGLDDSCIEQEYQKAVAAFPDIESNYWSVLRTHVRMSWPMLNPREHIAVLSFKLFLKQVYHYVLHNEDSFPAIASGERNYSEFLRSGKYFEPSQFAVRQEFHRTAISKAILAAAKVNTEGNTQIRAIPTPASVSAFTAMAGAIPMQQQQQQKPQPTPKPTSQPSQNQDRTQSVHGSDKKAPEEQHRHHQKDHQTAARDSEVFREAVAAKLRNFEGMESPAHSSVRSSRAPSPTRQDKTRTIPDVEVIPKPFAQVLTPTSKHHHHHPATPRKSETPKKSETPTAPKKTEAPTAPRKPEAPTTTKPAAPKTDHVTKFKEFNPFDFSKSSTAKSATTGKSTSASASKEKKKTTTKKEPEPAAEEEDDDVIELGSQDTDTDPEEYEEDDSEDSDDSDDSDEES